MTVYSFCKQVTLSLFMFAFLFCNQLTHAGMFGGIPIISDEEYQAMAPAQRQKYEQELQQQIANMPPAQQQAFMEDFAQAVYESLPPEEQQQVVSEIERINAMSEEEQKAYLAKMEKELEEMMAAQQQAQKAAEEPKPEPTPAPTEPEKPEEKTPTPAKISEKEKAIKEAVVLINEVIDGIDSFLVKLESRTDLQYKLNKWGKKKQIKSWDDEFEWKKFKTQLDSFRAQLDMLNDRDAKTKKYKYLSDLVDDEDVSARIYNLSVDLANYEPSIRGKENKPVAKKIRKKSNKSTRKLIDAFTEQLFEENNLIIALQDLIKKYDPQAAKLRAQEEARAKKAYEESKKKRRVSKVKVVGSEQYGSYYDYYDDPHGSSYGGSGDYDSPSRGRSGTSARRPSDRRRTGEGARKRPAPTKGKKPEKKKEPKKEDAAPAKKEEELISDRRAKRIKENLEEIIDNISDKIVEHGKLTKLDTYLKGNVFDKRLEKAIRSIHESLKIAENQFDTFEDRIKKLKKEEKEAYKKKAKTIAKEYEDVLKNVIDSIEKVEKDQALVANLSSEMKWKHFGQLPEDILGAQKAVQEAYKKGMGVPTQEQQKAIEDAQEILENLPSKKYLDEVKVPVPFAQLKKTAQDVIQKAKDMEKLK